MSGKKIISAELTKAQVIARADELDARRQEQINRQIDSINRLLGTQDLDPDKRYETEMQALNDAIIDLDHKLMMCRSSLRRLKRSLSDKLVHHPDGGYLQSLLDIIEEADE